MPVATTQGCALVHYATPEESARAVATLVESDLKGRKILVREDREPEGGPVPGSRPAVPRGGYGGAPRGGYGGAGGAGGFIPRGGAGGFRGAPRGGFGGGLDGAGPARPDFIPGTSLYVGNVSVRECRASVATVAAFTHPPASHPAATAAVVVGGDVARPEGFLRQLWRHVRGREDRPRWAVQGLWHRALCVPRGCGARHGGDERRGAEGPRHHRA